MLKKQYKCFFINECLVNQKTVKHCQSCRYNKCLSINMSPNKIDIQHSINNLKDYDKENIQNTVEYNNPDKEHIREHTFILEKTLLSEKLSTHIYLARYAFLI